MKKKKVNYFVYTIHPSMLTQEDWCAILDLANNFYFSQGNMSYEKSVVLAYIDHLTNDEKELLQ